MVEQDHRRVKKRWREFKRFFNARGALPERSSKGLKASFKFPKRFGTAPVEMWHNVLAT